MRRLVNALELERQMGIDGSFKPAVVPRGSRDTVSYLLPDHRIDEVRRQDYSFGSV